MALRDLQLPDACVHYDAQWLSKPQADALLDALTAAIAWETHRIRLFGREVASPRLSCWIGDPGARYTYSRTRFEPRSWPDALLALREQASAVAGEPFNAVLANLYRDGRDSMGWHSDDEPELGREPVIASVSLGAPRRFVFRHRSDHAQRVEIELAHGSLLLMRGTTQSRWQHALPRSTRVGAPRLNLTFRRIRDQAGGRSCASCARGTGPS